MNSTGENGIPLFAPDDDTPPEAWRAGTPTGDAVAFWEASTSDAEADTPRHRQLEVHDQRRAGGGRYDHSRIRRGRRNSAPTFPRPAPLPPTGTYPGAGGGTAKVSEEPDPDPARAGYTVRTVEYTNYVNEEGMILNGKESTRHQRCSSRHPLQSRHQGHRGAHRFPERRRHHQQADAVDNLDDPGQRDHLCARWRRASPLGPGQVGRRSRERVAGDKGSWLAARSFAN